MTVIVFDDTDEQFPDVTFLLKKVVLVKAPEL